LLIYELSRARNPAAQHADDYEELSDPKPVHSFRLWRAHAKIRIAIGVLHRSIGIGGYGKGSNLASGAVGS
jgi:hypothetical protein